MNENSEFKRGHRRTRSLDLTDSLDKLEIRRHRRQKFLENRAKFNQNHGPSAAPPPIPKSYFTKISNLNRNDSSDLSSSKQSNKNESSSTSSSVIKPSYISSIDEVDVLDNSSFLEKQQSLAQTSKLIRRFTSEMLNSNASSADSNSTLTVPEVSAYTSSSTLESQTFFDTPLQFQTDRDDEVITAAHTMPPNSTWATDEPTTEFESVTLRRPSDFLKHETHSTANLQSRHLSLESGANELSNIPQRSSTSSLHNISSSPSRSSASRYSTRPTVTSTASLNLTLDTPFRPLNWVKLPDKNGDETDAPRSDYPSWIPTTSNLHETKESANYFPTYSQTAVKSPMTETSPFQETTLREGSRISTSSEASTSSLPYFSGDQKTVSEFGRNSKTRSSLVTLRNIKVDDLSNETKTPSVGKITDKWEKPSSPKMVRRYSSNTLLSSSRRSQTPSIPVKSLVRKFSETN